jgi:hypothetical protein
MLAASIEIAWAETSESDQPAQPQAPPPPSITDPGPDFGTIPNGAQTVRPGRFNLEATFESSRSDDQDTRTNLVPTLLRVGVTKGFELRAQMNVLSQTRDTTGTTIGHGPLQLGFEQRFNRGDTGFLSPSFGIEGGLVLPVASAGMDSGKVEGLLTLNVDHFLSQSTVLT